MKIIREIQFTGKNLNDVFDLPCVQAILKTGYQSIWLMLRTNMMVGNSIATVGDFLVEYDDGTWDIIPATIK